jgi:glutamyl/glutaminyl-tRNA synthetase
VEPVFLLYNLGVKADFPHREARVAAVNPFSAADVEAALRHHDWLTERATPEMEMWMRDAAEWLGLQIALHAENQGLKSLNELLDLVFQYDAASLLRNKDNQAVMAREGAREVIRELANRVLEDGEVDSEGLREIIASLKEIFGSHGRKIFYPLRLALAGRTGEGELDRVILLLDRAEKLPFCVKVKGTRQRMLEFCAALS